MPDYMSELAQSLGLPHYAKQGPYGRKEGAVIGVRDGYLVAVGPSRAAAGGESVAIMTRFGTVSDPKAVETTVKAIPGKPHSAQVQAGADFAMLVLPYSISKPKAAEVAGMLKSMLEALKGVTRPLDPRCEKCGSTSAREIVLQNGAPAYFCEGCQHRLQQELDAAAMEYENLPSNFPMGVLYGVVSALIGSLAWGGVAYLSNRVFLYGAILIGYLVGWAVIKGMGKISRAGQVLVFLLTAASVLLGDAFFFSLVAAKQVGVGWGLNVVLAVLAHFWEIETQKSGIISMIFALVGAGYALYRVRKPKFKVKFERFGQPAT